MPVASADTVATLVQAATGPVPDSDSRGVLAWHAQPYRAASETVTAHVAAGATLSAGISESRVRRQREPGPGLTLTSLLGPG